MTPKSGALRPQPPLVHAAMNADELDRLNADCSIPVVFDIPSRKPVDLAFEGRQTAAFSIWSTRSKSGFISRPKIPFDMFTVRFVTSGIMSRNVSRNDDTLVAFDQALFTSFGNMRFQLASPGFATLAVSVSCAALIDACTAMGIRQPATSCQFDRIVNSRTRQMSSLRHSLTLLHHQLAVEIADADMMTPLLQEVITYQIAGAWPGPGELHAHGIVPASDRPIRSAIDFVEGNLGRKIKISEIADAAGLGVRALQVAFKRRVGCSPVSFLIARRLDKVHAILTSGTTLSIQEIAGTWGFTHMSDFARRYRERFGHSPRMSA